MNQVNLIGNTTSAIELRNTQNGTAFCRFSLAVRRDKDTTDFIDCEAWKTTAETLSKYVEKGDKLAVSGSLKVSSYTDKDGQNRRSWSVLVREFEFMQRKAKTETVEPTAQPTAQPTAEPNEPPEDEELPF